MRINRIGVIGAGTMGSGIAALAASAGIPVVLLDIPGEPDRNGLARAGIERALKARPASFMSRERVELVEVGNTEDDLRKLADCDWVVEAIIEKLSPKQALYEKLEPVLKPSAVVSSNTSGIPMELLLEGRSEGFRKHFLGTHFFNPPRYLHLLEVIPTPETSQETLATIEIFGRIILGKGIVRAKDVPGFVANRIGVYGMLQTVQLMEAHKLSIDEVDALTGPLIGRPNSATFRTADLTGLDVLSHVARELLEATGEDFALPGWVDGLVKEGRLGEKTKAGFYKKVGNEILTYDPALGEYRPQAKLKSAELTAVRALPLTQRLSAVLSLPGKYGGFMRELYARTMHYTLIHAAGLAYDLASVDQALERGFGWRMGPFKQMDAVGIERTLELFREAGLVSAGLLARPNTRFFKDGQQLSLTGGGYQAVPKVEGALELAAIKAAGPALIGSKEAALLNLGDGVALFEFRGKMNTIGESVFAILKKSLSYLDKHGYAGLVIGNGHQRVFSAGANLALILMAAQEGEWGELELAARRFQQGTQSLRSAPFPVVVAPFGLTLGGGAELTLHADAIQAHAELYMGLVEVGVGLIPAGGGTKELLFRFTRELLPYAEADSFEAVRRAFQYITMAETSTSALEAKEKGFLRHGDGITMNRDLLIGDAKRKVLALAPGYVPQVVGRISALGNAALGNLRYAIWQFREAGQISEHDEKIAGELAYVLSGGDGVGRMVSEEDILDLEREAFLKLLGTQKTQQRIAHMLKTGKPLRN